MKADWYLTRGTGAVAFVLITLVVALGVAEIARVATPRWPRFAIDGLHRFLALLAVVFLAIHILTAVLDSFAPITLLDAIIPFIGAYRPLWLGLGAVAFDLLLAVAITSAVRRRLGHRLWRGVHWLAYAMWPIALLHAFGTGSDVRQAWMAVIDVGCGAMMLTAVFLRIWLGSSANLRGRALAVGATLAFVLGVVVWLPRGPLTANWARRAGTPARLLPASEREPGS